MVHGSLTMQTRPASFEVIRRTALDWWDSWVNWTGAGLVWLLCWLTIVLGPPATFSLVSAAHRMAVRGESSQWRELVRDARRYFGVSWLWMLLNGIVVVLAPLNLNFYARLPSPWNSLIQGLLILLTGLWFVVQLFTVPYLMQQERKHLGIAMRNGLYTVLAAPGFSIVISIVSLIIAALSVALVAPLLLGGPGFLALLGCHGVNERLETYGIRDHTTPGTASTAAPGDTTGEPPGP